MEDNVTPEAVVPVAGNEELMAMSEFIKNLDVSLKLFLLLRMLILPLLLQNCRVKKYNSLKR
jgi:hypothetical protein